MNVSGIRLLYVLYTSALHFFEHGAYTAHTMRYPPYATVYKRIGETPLAALERFRVSTGIPHDVPLAYAGRLDPLATGTLLILIGDECRKQQHYHGLDKAYTFEILCGISSDTGDVLGLPQYREQTGALETERVPHNLTSLLGTQRVPYPHFSSKTVRGKPLFLWTLEGRIHEIPIPTVPRTLYTLTLRDHTTLTAAALATRINAQIEAIPPVTESAKALGNDFRRPAIRAAWKSLFETLPADARFAVLTCSTICSSGTYIRTLAPEIAQRLATTGLALSIHRTTIGRYVPIPWLGIGFWRTRV